MAAAVQRRLFVLVALIQAVLMINGVAGVWPQPIDMRVGQQAATINPSSFSIRTTSSSQILHKAIQRYQQQLFFPFSGTIDAKSAMIATQVQTLTVTVSSDSEILQFGVDESYNITVTNTGAATLLARTIFGAMRGLETFSQLIIFDQISQKYTFTDVPIVINDAPRFPWRY